MSNKKRYFTTSLTLGLVAAGAALAISGVNAITREQIRQNTLNAENKAKLEVFETATSFTDFEIVKNNEYVQKYCLAKDINDNTLGYVYSVSGKNSYGSISMMVGIDEYTAPRIAIVENTESFATILTNKYIIPLQNEEILYDDGDSIKCGATYGAKLISNMIKAAKEHYDSLKGDN